MKEGLNRYGLENSFLKCQDTRDSFKLREVFNWARLRTEDFAIYMLFGLSVVMLAKRNCKNRDINNEENKDKTICKWYHIIHLTHPFQLAYQIGAYYFDWTVLKWNYRHVLYCGQFYNLLCKGKECFDHPEYAYWMGAIRLVKLLKTALSQVCIIITQCLIVLFTSDVMYKNCKSLVYTPPHLLARFCKVSLSNPKNLACFFSLTF